MRPAGEDTESVTTSEKKAQYSVPASNAWGAKSWEEQAADVTEINNIPDLLRGLRAAAIDREKILLVRRFLGQGGEELHYLAENMEHIMKLLIFQNSRRQLLSILMHEFEAAEQHRDEHEAEGKAEGEEEKRHIDNLLRAVDAADDQCKQLEYWSDVRDMTRDGEILKASEGTHGWDHSWQGLDASGPEKQIGSPSDGSSDSDEVPEKKDKGKQPARGTNEIGIPGGRSDGAAETKDPLDTGKEQGGDASIPSVDPNKEDVFHSPEEETTQPQATSHKSAHSEPKEAEEDDDDQARERTPSEDEGDFVDTPPTGATPIEAITGALNGHTTADKGTASSKSTGEE
jgi:hypothetical protein